MSLCRAEGAKRLSTAELVIPPQVMTAPLNGGMRRFKEISVDCAVALAGLHTFTWAPNLTY